MEHKERFFEKLGLATKEWEVKELIWISIKYFFFFELITEDYLEDTPEKKTIEAISGHSWKEIKQIYEELKGGGEE